MWLSYLYLVVVVAGIPLALVVAAVASYFIPAKYWLRLQAAAATLQGYTVSVAGIYPSVSLLAALGAWRSLFAHREIFRVVWMRWLLGLLIVQLVAMAWSPEPFGAVRYAVFAAPMFTLCAAMYGYALRDPAAALRIMTWTLRIAAIAPILVIVCRVMPAAEGRFYGLRLTQFFVSPNILAALFVDGGNNVIAADKAGGLFINANTASVYLGVCACFGWGLAKVTGDFVMRALALLFWVAVFFTGSKAGMIAAVCVPIAAWAIRFSRLRRINLLGLILFCALGVVAALAFPFVSSAYQSSGFTEASISTLQSRQAIWDFARRMMTSHFLLGLGHGGWEEQFAFYSYANGFRGVMPAHNAFLILWSQAGAIAALMGLGFVLSLTWWCIRHIWHHNAASALSGSLLWAFAWYVFQSQGENFGLVGEFHLTPLLGMAMGLTLAHVGVGKTARLSVRPEEIVSAKPGAKQGRHNDSASPLPLHRPAAT